MDMSARTLLITGVSGYVGEAVAARAAAAGYHVTGTYFTHAPTAALWPAVRARIDEIPALIARGRPAVVLHAAAAWRTVDEAQAVIVEGTRGIAAAAAAVGSRLIHLSTDLVFDGEHGPYREDDRPAPVNFYGAAKAEAERLVAALHPAAVIVRTSLVTCFDPPDPRTEPVLAALRGARPAVTLFTDEYRCPIRRGDLAGALVELAGASYTGILHVAGPERLSRYELGQRIATYYGLAVEPGLHAGLTAASGLLRPRDCTLAIGRAQHVLQTPLQKLPQTPQTPLLPLP